MSRPQTYQSAAAASSAKNADRIVECLRSAVADGTAGLADVPSLVERVIREELWRVRETKLSDEPRTFLTFAEFVCAAPPAGLGTELNTLWRLCEDAPDALDLLIAQMPAPGRGGDRRSQKFRELKECENAPHKTAAKCSLQNGKKNLKAENIKNENVTFENNEFSPTTPPRPHASRGNSRQYSLLRLKNKNPELYAEVLRGNRSANEAMIAAGLRRPQLTVSAVNPIAVARVLGKNFDRPALLEIIASLRLFLQSSEK